jgi:hypothetical protein
MSWKDAVWICLIVGAVVLACLARHFMGDVLFVVEHFVAAGMVHTAGFVHFVSALAR